MTSVLIIRFHYKQDDLRFLWRFNFFKDTVLPRILNQTDSDFDIAIRCYDYHNELFRSLSPRIKTFQVKNEGARYKQSKNKRKTFFHDFVKWEDVIGLEMYDLQMGLDSDDLIHPDYVLVMKRHVATAKTSVHISFQPEMLRLKTGKKTKMMEYGPKQGSAFLGLYQPDKNNYKFIYHDSHLQMWKYAEKSITIPVGYCMATAHDRNESTGK